MKPRHLAPSLLLATIALVRCSPPSAGVFAQRSLPDRESFPDVAQVLIHKCGELDCHGSAYRNFRLYGNEGLRLSPSDRPLVPACTTQAELDQDYESVVGLEPEAMSTVVAAGGANPERLTLLRKPLGLEAHKGLTLLRSGDDAYLCLTSWLAGATEVASCLRAIPATACLASSPADSGRE